MILFLILLYQSVASWISVDIPISVAWTVKQPFPVDVTAGAIRSAIDLYDIPGLALNVYLNDSFRDESKQKFDGRNTISFSSNPEHPAYTTFYLLGGVRHEFDMFFDPSSFSTVQTFHFALLHELGHVYGLNHPNPTMDTIMGRPMLQRPDGSYRQERVYLSLTKYDVLALFRMTPQKLTMDSIYNYTDTIQEQITGCGSSRGLAFHREFDLFLNS